MILTSKPPAPEAKFTYSTGAVVALILAFGFCVRAATFQIPLLDQHAWRQADTAGISRAFAEERYNILYPQVEWRGAAATGYVETGLELHAFFVASFARLTKFKPEIGRLLSAIFFIASCRMVWLFTRRRYGDRTGMLAAYFYAFGFPLMLFMERAFMNEALLVCLSLVSIVSAQRYLVSSTGVEERPGPRAVALVMVIVATALTGAVKLPYLIVLAPVWGLFIERFGWRAFVRIEPWLVSIIAIGVTVAWYTHAHALGQQSGLTFGIFDKAFNFELIGSERFYRMVSQRMFRDILGPIGLVGLISGAAVMYFQRRWCEGLALASFVAYLFIVPGGNLMHNYYQLAIMPTLATIVAVGWRQLINRFAVDLRTHSTVTTTLLVLVALSTTIRSASFHSWYDVAPEYGPICTIGAERVPNPSDRILIAGTADPRLMFCINRKGWAIDSPVPEARLAEAVEQGARLVIVYPEAADTVVPWLAGRSEEVPLNGPIRMFVLRR